MYFFSAQPILYRDLKKKKKAYILIGLPNEPCLELSVPRARLGHAGNVKVLIRPDQHAKGQEGEEVQKTREQ